jgi:hypothetical protein
MWSVEQLGVYLTALPFGMLAATDVHASPAQKWPVIRPGAFGQNQDEGTPPLAFGVVQKCT